MSNFERSLWSKLNSQNIVNAEYLDINKEFSPWYLRILLGFSGWVAALFALGFVATMFSFLFKEDFAVVLALLGMASIGSSVAIFKLMPENDFSEQLGIVFNLTGQLMLAVGIYQFLESIDVISWRNDALFYLTLGLVQVALVFLIPDFTSRALSSLFVFLAVSICFDKFGFKNAGILLASAAFSLIWLRDYLWKEKAQFFSAIGYGAAAGLLILNIDVSGGEGVLKLFNHYSKNAPSQLNLWIARGGLFLVFLSALSFIVKQYDKSALPNKFRSLAIIVALLALASLVIDGIAGPLIICLIGFYVQRKILLYCGILSLIGFFSWYYYNLDLTLLTKSALLIGLGLLLLTSFYYFYKTDRSITWEKQKEISDSKIKWLGFVSVFLVLLIANYNIYQKETILSDGKRVYLELAPVDPRSIMQGDYMRLRFKVENEVETTLKDSENQNQEGFMLLKLNGKNVGNFIGIYQGNLLNNDEAIIKYRKRSYDIKLATNAFFFQEGKAKEFENAKYGEFRVDDNGEIILNALLDENLQILGLNRPNQ